MLRALDSKGFYISTGSACSSKKNKRPVLEAMHITPQISENAAIYDLSGRRISTSKLLNGSALPKGIYIMNGKKVVIR